MALLPTGSDRLAEIRTAYVDIVIKSKGRQIFGTAESDAESSSLKVVGLDLEQVSIPSQEKTEKYSDHRGLSVHEFTVSGTVEFTVSGTVNKL